MGVYVVPDTPNRPVAHSKVEGVGVGAAEAWSPRSSPDGKIRVSHRFEVCIGGYATSEERDGLRGDKAVIVYVVTAEQVVVVAT